MAVVLEDRGAAERRRRRRAAGRSTASTPTSRSANVRTLEQIVARSISQPRFYMTLLDALRRAGAGARRDRHLRRPVVRRRAAHARDRHPDGARRAGTDRARPDRPPRDDPGGRRRRRLASPPPGSCRRLLSTFLFATDPRDLATFAAVSVTLGVVALLASYLPARRATRSIRWWLYGLISQIPDRRSQRIPNFHWESVGIRELGAWDFAQSLIILGCPWNI